MTLPEVCIPEHFRDAFYDMEEVINPGCHNPSDFALEPIPVFTFSRAPSGEMCVKYHIRDIHGYFHPITRRINALFDTNPAHFNLFAIIRDCTRGAEIPRWFRDKYGKPFCDKCDEIIGTSNKSLKDVV